jgi:hypothetical protein
MRNRADNNRDEIISDLESFGAVVDKLPGGNGRPDLLVGIFSRNYLLEVKRDGKQQLNDLQQNWHNRWKGQRAVVWNKQQARLACGIITG